MIDNDHSDAGVDDLIAWHKEMAAIYASCQHQDAALRSVRLRHETTAELLAELLEWREDEIKDDY